ncbi:MAG TPA: type I-C CRISPR-associated protein Cas8c/Csd1 [Kiritimatiellia bacterium]|nr:type I-C CRISPR-associated protein Cas8c/Csd1 [Kiritimatiellia bacterium]
MSFWQYLAESYDKNAGALKTNYPLSATSISNQSEWVAVIVINGKGEFQKAYKIEKAKRDKKTGKEIVPYVSINIPVTEKSMARSSTVIAPHPVFDQYEFLKGSGEKFDAYLQNLKNFADSESATVQVKAIRDYIAKKTVETDLSALQPKVKTNIVFEVEVRCGDPQTKVWEDAAFFEAWHQYYRAAKDRLIDEKRKAREKLAGKEKLAKDEKKKLEGQAKSDEDSVLDYITGETLPTAKFHPRKINGGKDTANARLISDNDTANFTFRGRFEDSSQAVSIGYATSQKAHQFLRYLIGDRGIQCGTQVILSFTVGSAEKLLPPPVDDESVWSFLQECPPQTENDRQIALRAETGIDYANALRESLAGFGYGKTLAQHVKTAVIALDAASKGRLSVTFYRELARNEYLKNIADWHDGCKWNQRVWSDETRRFVPYIGAPSVDRIIEAVYGKPRSRKDESYTRIKKVARERLLRCIFDGAFLPADYVISAVRRAANPLAVTKKDKFDRKGFEQLVSTACALVRKDFKQRNTEDYTLSIEHDRTDRDYLYGRLLGAADKLEEYALHKKDNDRVVTAAIRYMQTFSQRPFRTWQTIHECLVPYIQVVKGSFAFQEIEAVKNLFIPGDFERDASLNGSYLIGYYHERTYIDGLVAAAKAKKQSTPDNTTETPNE